MNAKTLADYDREGEDEDNFTWQAFEHHDGFETHAAAAALNGLADTWEHYSSDPDDMAVHIDHVCRLLLAWKKAMLTCREYTSLKKSIDLASSDERWADTIRVAQRLDVLHRSTPNLAALMRAYEENQSKEDA